MKTKYFFLSVAFTLATLFSFASAKTDTIKVYGNCESCKDRIEKAAKEAGATTAEWNEKTELLVVSYDDAATTNIKIQQKIASVGHDTQDVKATEGSYKKLEKCCQYQRKTAGHASSANRSCCNPNCCEAIVVNKETTSSGKGYYSIGNNAAKLANTHLVMLAANANNNMCNMSCCI